MDRLPNRREAIALGLGGLAALSLGNPVSALTRAPSRSVALRKAVMKYAKVAWTFDVKGRNDAFKHLTTNDPSNLSYITLYVFKDRTPAREYVNRNFFDYFNLRDRLWGREATGEEIAKNYLPNELMEELFQLGYEFTIESSPVCINRRRRYYEHRGGIMLHPVVQRARPRLVLLFTRDRQRLDSLHSPRSLLGCLGAMNGIF
jgi:hypothetical protein